MKPIQYRFKIQSGYDVYFTSGRGCDSSTGEYVSRENSYASEKVTVDGEMVYLDFSVDYVTGSNVFFYNGSTFLGYTSISTGKREIPVKQGATHFVLTLSGNNTQAESINKKTIIYQQKNVNPTYKNDLSKEYELESNQQFFRQKLSGKLAFIRDDYDFINQQDFNTEFILLLQESKDVGKTWSDFYSGKFMKTDCTWNDDDKKCEVNPNVYDDYNDVIAGLDKEYNLIKLNPEIKRLTIQKRPLIQVYLPGESVVSCFLGGMYWEQDVIEATDDEEFLVNKCYFANTKPYQEIVVKESPYEDLTNQVFVGSTKGGYSNSSNYKMKYFEIKEMKTAENNSDYFIMTNGIRLYNMNSPQKYQFSSKNNYVLRGDIVEVQAFANFATSDFLEVGDAIKIKYTNTYVVQPSNYFAGFVMYDSSKSKIVYVGGKTGEVNLSDYPTAKYFRYCCDNNTDVSNCKVEVYKKGWEYSQSVTVYNTYNPSFKVLPKSATLKAISPETKDVKVEIQSTGLYMRYLLDKDIVQGLETYEIPVDDLVQDNRNYKRCIGYAFDVIETTNNYSETPTEYGVRPDGTYYAPPYSLYGDKYYPVARSTWNYASYWFHFSLLDPFVEESARTEFELRDTYPIHSVIQVLLEQFSDIKHEGTQEYSQFLYADYNPISYQNFHLLLSPKSNILHGNYDQPAMKAETTLNTILKMLRDVYKCFWFIEDGKLKIEHISYFRNGGTYSSSPEVGTDLTKIENIRNGKKWGFLTSSYEFDKSDMPERFQFSWMDDVTEGFEGYPIEVNSKYVSPGRIEDINVTGFTTDVDYMMLNPGAISQDGFALFAAIYRNGRYELPIVERNVDGADLRLQNGYLSWITLQPNYYLSDLPAKKVVINKTDYLVTETSRKRKQKVKFPTLEDINTKKLVKTYMGNGQIEKISVNLSSRINEVTLKYDTEQ